MGAICRQCLRSSSCVLALVNIVIPLTRTRSKRSILFNTEVYTFGYIEKLYTILWIARCEKSPEGMNSNEPTTEPCSCSHHRFIKQSQISDRPRGMFRRKYAKLVVLLASRDLDRRWMPSPVDVSQWDNFFVWPYSSLHGSSSVLFSAPFSANRRSSNFNYSTAHGRNHAMIDLEDVEGGKAMFTVTTGSVQRQSASLLEW